ncbi:MAG: hypothetical protein R2695_03015 [Acidimicrobiales bacterium]
MRALLDTADAGTPADIHTIPRSDRPELDRGLALIEGRSSPRFTRFDGNLATDGNLRGATPRPRATGHVTSATRLESWSACPHGYFVRHVLGVHPVDATPGGVPDLPARARLPHAPRPRPLARRRDPCPDRPPPGTRGPTPTAAASSRSPRPRPTASPPRGSPGVAVYWQRPPRS